MGTIAEKLTYLNGTKTAIKDAIEEKGVTVPAGATFRDYADLIGDISGGGAQVASGVFTFSGTNVDKRFECGFRPKTIILLCGIYGGVTDANYRAAIYINENEKASAIRTSGTGSVAIYSNSNSPVAFTNFSIDSSGFTVNTSVAQQASRTWMYIALSDAIEAPLMMLPPTE